MQTLTSSTSSNISTQSPRSRTPQHVHGSSDIGGSPQAAQQGTAPRTTTPGSIGQSSTPPPLQVHPPFQAQHGHAHVHGHVHGGVPTSQFPPQLQQAFAQFHAVNQQLAAQLAAIGNNPMLQGMHTNQAQAQPFQQPAFAPPSLQQILAQQQQQARATGGQQGTSGTPQQDVQANGTDPTAQGGAPAAPGITRATTPSPAPGNTNTVVRENVGPNGERWQMVIQSGPIQFNPNNVLQNYQGAPAHAVAGNTRHPSPGLHGNHQAQNAAISGIGRAQTPNIALARLQSNLSTIEASMAGGSPPPESVFDQAREMLRSIPDLPHERQTSLPTRIDGLASQARQLRDNLHNLLVREAHERVASQRTTQGADSSAVYVLSSPIGPHALLVSPSGLYTTPWQLPSIVAAAPHSYTHQTPTPTILSQPPTHQHIVNRQQPQDNAAQVAQVQQPAQPPMDAAQAVQAQQQQQANQARDLARILLPLGGHLWLMIRLFGFVYFFTAGAGWRRTILLGLAAALVFIAKTGMFRPVVQGLWDPIRRHAEGLVPLAGNEPPRAAAAEADNNTDATSTQPANREPTPQEAAERLLQERERQDGNFVRQSIRRVERAIALFVASLVPGVGERHIAAREAAEAARQAEAREREEQARSEEEEEEARQRQEESAPENAGANESGAAAIGVTEGSATAQQEHAAQPPLFEV